VVNDHTDDGQAPGQIDFPETWIFHTKEIIVEDNIGQINMRMKWLVAVLFLLIVAGVLVISLKTKMEITSSAFINGGVVPQEFTCDGKNVNPPILISGVPEAAKSLVLFTDDVDAPAGVFTHWVVYDMFPGITRIDPGATPEGTPGTNTFGKEYYGGPCPNAGTHRYYFRIYALDTLLKLPWGVTRDKVETAMKGHVLDSGELMGTYTKK